MTDDSQPSSDSKKQKPARPQPSGATPKKSAPKKQVGPRPDPIEMLKKIPLPYLGGGIAALVMVLFVVKAAMTPLPGEMAAQSAAPPSQQQESVPPESAGTTQPQQQEAPPTPEIPTPEGAEGQADTPRPAAALPEYVGPREQYGEEFVSSGLPIMERLGEGIKKLGREVIMSKEQFEEATQQFDTEDLDGDPFLAYRVRLPHAWRFMGPRELKDMQLNNRLMGVMAYFVSPADLELRSSLRIKAQRMTHMMSPRDWIYHYINSNRYVLQALSVYGDDRAEGIYVVTEMDISYVVRIAVVISGPRVVTAEYFVPMQKYEEEKDFQTWGIASFHLKKKDLTPPEETKMLYFFDVASAQYPASWVIQDPNIVSVDQMNASVVNMEERLKDKEVILRGRVDVFMFTKTDYREKTAFDTLNEWMQESQTKLGQKVGRFVVSENREGLLPESQTVYLLENPENKYQEYQYWLAILKGQDYYYFVGLLTPPSETDPYNWSRNTGAFDHMIKTLKEEM